MFEWKDAYSVQVKEIDAQHRQLFQLAGELYTAMATGKGAGVLDSILTQLVDYTRKHFSYEEALMRQNRYPDYAAHKAQHDALTKQVVDFRAEFQAGKKTMSVQLFHFLQEWLQHHIADSDRKYTPYFQGKAVPA